MKRLLHGYGAVLLATSAFVLGVSTVVIAQEFNGYPCTVDCSGHQAGYDWAEANGITDAYECGGNSQSFIEGCESYAEEYSQEKDSWNVDPDESSDIEMEDADGF